jgi:hypothetical protein
MVSQSAELLKEQYAAVGVAATHTGCDRALSVNSAASTRMACSTASAREKQGLQRLSGVPALPWMVESVDGACAFHL